MVRVANLGRAILYNRIGVLLWWGLGNGIMYVSCLWSIIIFNGVDIWSRVLH